MGHEVAIVALDCDINNSVFSEECPPEVELLLFRRTSLIGEVFEKQLLVKRWKPDVTYLCSFGLRNFIAFQKNIVSEHSELGSSRENNSPARTIYETILEHLSIFLSRGIVCVSRYLVNLYSTRMRKCGIDKPILYFPYAFHASEVKPGSRVCAGLKNSKDRSRRLLYVGSVEAEYGIQEMLGAVQIALEDNPDILFDLAGGGNYLKQARDWIASNKLAEKVVVHGYIGSETLSSLVDNAEVCLCPMRNSIRDTARSPSKLFMYLAQRKRIVTCAVGEPLNLLQDNAFYYEPGSPSSMAQAIRKALSEGDSHCISDEFLAVHSWEHRASEFNDWLSREVVPRNRTAG